MDATIAAAIINGCCVTVGAVIGGIGTYQVARLKVKTEIKHELADDMHEQLVYLRRAVRKGETDMRDCLDRHHECERKLLTMRLEIARLKPFAAPPGS